MGNVATVEQREIAAAPQASEAVSLLAVIDRAARDPAVDIDKMERLMLMHERFVAKQAEVAFAEALADMQQELPVIAERGVIKNKQGGVQSTYALWEDINEALKPVLTRFGFALSFRTSTASGIEVTGILSHRAGHREETSITLPADVSGSKNAVQAVASSVSYGKRYTAGALLNLTSHGDDDDGQSAVAQKSEPVITKAQLGRLINVVSKCGPGAQDRFNSDYPDPSQVQAAHYDAIINSLESAAIKYQAALSKRSSSSE